MSGGSSTAGEVERRIRAYEAMGWHRTGWEGDDAAADWLIAELGAAGVEAREQSFRAPRWRWERAEVHVTGGGTVFGEPLSDGGLTPPEGVSGRVGFVGDGEYDGSPIALWRRGPDDTDRLAVGIYDDLAALQAAGARAVVLVMGDEHGNAVLRNAERPWEPIDLPVLQVAPADAGSLAEGAIGELVIEGRREVVEARNVVGEIAGVDSEAAPAALITPKSGWFTCAAERGGGIAVWLAAAERIARGERPRRGLRLVASSGHELHHLGLEAYLESLGEGVTEVAAWVHLGASIGAKRGAARLAASDAELMGLAQAALAAAGIEREAFAVGRSGYGEARNIAEAGGRYVSLLGGHPYFHSPMDVFERAVDVDLVVRHVDAVESVVRGLLG